jgi:hypothetical protein
VEETEVAASAVKYSSAAVSAADAAADSEVVSADAADAAAAATAAKLGSSGGTRHVYAATTADADDSCDASTDPPPRDLLSRLRHPHAAHIADMLRTFVRSFAELDLRKLYAAHPDPDALEDSDSGSEMEEEPAAVDALRDESNGEAAAAAASAAASSTASDAAPGAPASSVAASSTASSAASSQKRRRRRAPPAPSPRGRGKGGSSGAGVGGAGPGPGPDERVRAFLTRAEESMRKHPLWRDDTSAEWEATNEELERFVMGKLYSVTFAAHPACARRDARLAARLQALSFVGPRHLDLVEPSALLAPGWRLAQAALRDVDGARAPADKLTCIMNACRIIALLLQLAAEERGRGDRGVGADDFLPALIYTVIRSQPERLYSNLRFIGEFRSPSKLMSEEGYFVSRPLRRTLGARTLRAPHLQALPRATVKRTILTADPPLPTIHSIRTCCRLWPSPSARAPTSSQ